MAVFAAKCGIGRALTAVRCLRMSRSYPTSGNVFLLGNGRLVLGDLGISKVVGVSNLAKTQVRFRS